MYIDNYSIDLFVSPEISNGSTYTPVTAICYGFGIEAQWIPQTKGITISVENITNWSPNWLRHSCYKRQRSKHSSSISKRRYPDVTFENIN